MSGYVGVDVGATTLRSVVGDAEGAVLGRAERATPPGDGDRIAEAIAGVVREACRDAGVAPAEAVAAAIGSVGPLEQSRGVAVDPPNLAATEIELVEPLVDLLGADVYLHNDAAAGAIGERYYGPERVDDVLYCTVSTGVGAGAIVDGTVLEGAEGNAAEVGHVVLDPDSDRQCGCGGFGHWEAYCSGEHLPTYARELRDGEELETDLALESVTAADLYAAAGSDPLATAVVERAGRWNALGVANAIHAFDPAVVAIGGGVAVHNPDRVVGAVRDHLPELAVPHRPEIRLATRGADAVVMGALASALTAGTGTR